MLGESDKKATNVFYPLYLLVEYTFWMTENSLLKF